MQIVISQLIILTHMTERPLGVTIIGILWILLAFLSISAGILFSLAGTLIAGIFGLMAGIFIVIIGIIDLALGIGCFNGWPWVWTLCVILAIIHLILGIGGLFITGFSSLIAIIIILLILYYLFQPHVKGWFGKN